MTELERWKEHHKEFAAIEEFLYWMSEIHQAILTEFAGQEPYILSEGAVHDKMYEFFGIDHAALEQERSNQL